jgi:hypothetical protein
MPRGKHRLPIPDVYGLFPLSISPDHLPFRLQQKTLLALSYPLCYKYFYSVYLRYIGGSISIQRAKLSLTEHAEQAEGMNLFSCRSAENLFQPDGRRKTHALRAGVLGPNHLHTIVLLNC